MNHPFYPYRRSWLLQVGNAALGLAALAYSDIQRNFGQSC